MKKEPKVIYGIKITKPFSKEMYAHNDEVAENMRIHLRAEIINTYRRAIGEVAANGGMNQGEEDLRFIVKSFSGYEFGMGYDLEDIKNEGLKLIEDAANWMMHEEYAYLCFKGYVPRTHKMMIGFEWEKMDYSSCAYHYEKKKANMEAAEVLKELKKSL